MIIGMFEFAQEIGSLYEAGWKIASIDYGEERLGIGPSIVFQKNGKNRKFHYHDDISIFRQEVYGLR